MKTETNRKTTGPDVLKSRRSLVTGMGVAVAGLAAVTMSEKAEAQNRRRTREFEPARHELDAWLGEATGSHRIFIDSASAAGGTDALLYASNLVNAQINAYDGEASDLDIVVCFRHFSTPYGYTDAIWKKYGAPMQGLMQPAGAGSGQAPTMNPLNGGGGPGAPAVMATIESVLNQGIQFAICDNATRFVAGQIANATNASLNDILDELHANAIPNSRFVPAGVMALTRAQEYGYSVLIAG
jgi:intracellular sulfur oxidation DsrE/DsrF family protein